MPPFGADVFEAVAFHGLEQEPAVGEDGVGQGSVAVVGFGPEEIVAGAHGQFVAEAVHQGEVNGGTPVVHGAFAGIGNVSWVWHLFPELPLVRPGPVAIEELEAEAFSRSSR